MFCGPLAFILNTARRGLCRRRVDCFGNVNRSSTQAPFSFLQGCLLSFYFFHSSFALLFYMMDPTIFVSFPFSFVSLFNLPFSYFLYFLLFISSSFTFFPKLIALLDYLLLPATSPFILSSFNLRPSILFQLLSSITPASFLLHNLNIYPLLKQSSLPL